MEGTASFIHAGSWGLPPHHPPFPLFPSISPTLSLFRRVGKEDFSSTLLRASCMFYWTSSTTGRSVRRRMILIGWGVGSGRETSRRSV